MNARTIELPLKISRETLEYWAEQLEQAATLKAGVMDSDNRHIEVQRAIQSIVIAIAEDIRSTL